MITQIKTFILREQNVEQILWEKKSSYEGNKKKKKRKEISVHRQGERPIMLYQHTSLNNSVWAEPSNFAHKCFFLLSF